MVAWTNLYGYARPGERSPSHLVVERANQRVSAGAEQNDPAIVWLGLIAQPGLDMVTPEFAFVLRPAGKVHDVFNGKAILQVPGEKRFESFLDPRGSPLEEIARLLHSPSDLVTEPEKEI